MTRRSASSPAATPAAIAAADFAARLSALQSGPSVAVAFSGGGDSLALLVLAARWAKRSRNRRVVAYTVDHGLRKGSAAEARHCARVAASLGVTHRILTWRGAKPASDIQAAARDARYRLLAQACARDGVASLLVAHHLEDQAETFLLRLARGSGVDGLAGMAARRPLDAASGVMLLRPLLDVPRERLRAVVARAGLTPVDDPSNANPRFDRVRMRGLLADLSSVGLTPQRLAGTAGRMARAREALGRDVADWFAAFARHAAMGHLEADADALRAAPSEIGLRVLADSLRIVSGQAYPPRFEALEALYAALADGRLAKARTLHGCRLLLRGSTLLVMREMAAALEAPPVPLKLRQTALWDHRFAVRLTRAPRGAGGVEVRALGSEGLRAVRRLGLAEPEGPKLVLPTLPALWAGRVLAAAPHFGTVSPDYGFSADFVAHAPLSGRPFAS